MGLFSHLVAAQKGSNARLARAAETVERKKAYDGARQINGKPWWYSDRDAMLINYQDEDQPDRELVFASERGWYIADMAAEGGHVNVGRTATGAVLTGGISLLFGGSRKKGKLTINWRREGAGALGE